MEFTLKDIAGLLNGKIEGDGSQKISGLAKIEEGKPGTIAFLANPKYENHLYTTQASAVIISHKLELKESVSATLIRVDDPYNAFTALLEEYQRVMALMKTGKEKPVHIGKKTSIGSGHYLGAFSYIGNHCKIGNNVKIHPHAYIGDNCVIGDNTIVLAGAKIVAGSQIGSYCTLHPGAVIGSDGFGFAPQEDGSYKAIPQIGNVIIEDHVSIGANSTVDCATMGSTIIREGVKIDNLVQVAHNVEIGEHTVIAAQVGISGSAKIGKNCIMGGQAGISGHLSIPNRTTVGSQCGIMSPPKEEGKSIIGSPAFDYKDYLRSYAVFRNLPDFRRRIEQLEEKVVNLPTTE